MIVLCGLLALVVMPTSVSSAFSCLCVACWFELLFLDPTVCMPQGVLRLAVRNVWLCMFNLCSRKIEFSILGH